MSPACAIRSQIADDERRWRSSVVRMKSSGNQFKRRDALPRGGLQHLDAVLVGAGQEKDLVAVEPHEAGDGIGRDHLVGKADMRGAVRVGDGGRQVIGLGSHLRALEPSAADLKFLQQSRRGSFRNFKSKSGTRIINLLVPTFIES